MIRQLVVVLSTGTEAAHFALAFEQDHAGRICDKHQGTGFQNHNQPYGAIMSVVHYNQVLLWRSFAGGFR